MKHEILNKNYEYIYIYTFIYIIMLLYRVQVYIRILVIREKMNQVKISQEDKAEIVNGECHYFSLSKQNMLVISVATVRCAIKKWIDPIVILYSLRFHNLHFRLYYHNYSKEEVVLIQIQRKLAEKIDLKNK
jgi:hypothetical protein